MPTLHVELGGLAKALQEQGEGDVAGTILEWIIGKVEVLGGNTTAIFKLLKVEMR